MRAKLELRHNQPTPEEPANMHDAIGRTQAQQKRVRSHACNSDSYAFFNLLTGPELFNTVENELPVHRERLFPPTETLSMFLGQALSEDRSCQKAVDQAAVKRLAGGMSPCSTHTGAYCGARQRLPTQMVRTLSRYTAACISTRAPLTWRWQGHRVRLVDGTTLTLPDTRANQTAYPQPESQDPGLGFPMCRMVGIVCLGSGALLNVAVGTYQGKGGDEQSLLRSILDTLERGDLLLGDANFATYFLLCALRERGIQAVFEQHGARRSTTDFRRGQRLGARDHLIRWIKPLRKPIWMSQTEYDQAPSSLAVRELRTGGKILITTLTCAKTTSKQSLKLLYRGRWHIELDLRNIKTTLGMERLSCRTPEMALKEIWVYVLAYNLIRLMMAHAATLTHCLPRQISFKHTVQIWIAWNGHANQFDSEEQFQDLFILIAQKQVGKRCGRIEPRAIKRRPKNYPILDKPRHTMREHIREHGHPKKIK